MSLSLDHVSRVYFDRLFVAKNNTALSSAIKAKVLLVDRHTMPIVSVAYPQSQLLQHEVILVEMLDRHRELSSMRHLNCVVYIKPEADSIAMLCAELRLPHYHHYQVFFSNSVAKSDIEKLARADEHEVICQVTEVFQDFSVVNDNLFSVAVGDSAASTVQEAASLLSVLLLVKKCPAIKYEPKSLPAKRLASEMLYFINSNSNNNLFDDVNRTSDAAPMLIILDRKSDPITPLVTPWTYQSMIHELIGIHRNVTTLESGEQLPLSNLDTFFAESMYLNYGDLTEKFQQYVDTYKQQTKQSAVDIKTQDLGELKKLLTRFPEFKKLSANILKHLNIISEIDKQISTQNLWVVGELQQTIVCALENHSTIRSKLMDVVSDLAISTENKVKLLLLYTAKFPDNNADLNLLVTKLNDPITTNPPPTQLQLLLIRSFNRVFGGVTKTLQTPPADNISKLFGQNRIKIQLLFNTAEFRTPQTDNIFMQYVPKLNELLARVANPTPNGALPDLATLVPDVVERQYGTSVGVAPQEVIIYFKGGVTYEEARLVHELSRVNPSVNYIIGGDGILNSKLWLDRMCDMVNSTSDAAPVTDRQAQLREIL